MPIDLVDKGKPEPTPRPITGRKVLFALVAFFSAIIAINAVMMVLAIRTMPGLEVRSAYEASQRFNRELDAIAAQDRRGWQVDITTAGLKNGTLAVAIRDQAGAPLTGLDVSARFERPTDARLDRGVTLIGTGNGRYEAAAPQLARGQWLLSVEIRENGERRFLSHRRISVSE